MLSAEKHGVGGYCSRGPPGGSSSPRVEHYPWLRVLVEGRDDNPARPRRDPPAARAVMSLRHPRDSRNGRAIVFFFLSFFFLFRLKWSFFSICILEHRTDFLFCVLHDCVQVQGTTGAYCFWRCVWRIPNITRFNHPRKWWVVAFLNAFNVWEVPKSYMYLRRYIAVEIAASFVTVAKANGEVCTIGEVAC